jgi:hypothetical protein
LLILTGCHKETTKIDPCGLLTKAEIEAVQQSPVRETKPSEHPEGGLLISQCFYSTADFSKSVAVTVTQPDPENRGTNTPRDFWSETFNEHREERGEERERAVPPRKIDNLGDEAYWTSGIGAALYLLKGDAFIRIAVGASGSEESRLEKARSLAAKALTRL